MFPLSSPILPPQMTKFQAVSEIPACFIERNASLCGRVRSVTDRGVEVEHIPIHLPVLSPLLLKYKGNDLFFPLSELENVWTLEQLLCPLKQS